MAARPARLITERGTAEAAQGGPLARDKRLRRAEARRRHRERLRTQDEVAGTPQPAPEPPTAPPSFLATLASGLRLPDVGADIRALPWIARHTWAFALPLAAVVGAFLVGLDPTVFRLEARPEDPLSLVAARGIYQFVLVPPPVTSVFIAGVLTPRAGWLVGAIIGLVSSVAFVALAAIHGQPNDPATALTPAAAFEAIVALLPLYVLLGGFAGWYRRWLLGMQQRTRQRAEERRKEQAREAKRAKAAPARR